MILSILDLACTGLILSISQKVSCYQSCSDCLYLAICPDQWKAQYSQLGCLEPKSHWFLTLRIQYLSLLRNHHCRDLDNDIQKATTQHSCITAPASNQGLQTATRSNQQKLTNHNFTCRHICVCHRQTYHNQLTTKAGLCQFN